MALSPNPWFDQAYYLQGKANQLNATSYGGRTNWTPAEALQAIQDAGMTPYEHFTNYGVSEGLDTSTSFDVQGYLELKARQLNAIAQDGRTDWTPRSALEAIQNAGMDPVTHYMLYGKNEGFTPLPAPALTANSPFIPPFTPYVSPVVPSPSTTEGGSGGGGGDAFTVTNSAGVLTYGGSATGPVTMTVDAGKLVFTRGGATATTTPLLTDVADGGIPAVTVTAAIFATAGLAAKLADGAATVDTTGATGTALDTVGSNIAKVVTDGVTGTLQLTSAVTATSISALFSRYAGTAATVDVGAMSASQITALDNTKIATDGITGAVTGLDAAALTALHGKEADIALASLTGDLSVSHADIAAFSDLQTRLAVTATVTISAVADGATATVNDFVNAAFTGTIAGTTGKFNITAGAGDQTITTAAGEDILNGGEGNDTLNGGAGRDTLTGGDGSDTLNGGAAQDTLTGGDGNDTFKFNNGDFSWVSTNEYSNSYDTITDWTTGDIIDFSDTLQVPTGLPTSAVADTAGISNTGLASFDSSDTTLSDLAYATYKAIYSQSAGAAAVFVYEGASYLVVRQTVSALIKLEGVVATGLVITDGNITGFVV